MPYKDLQVRKEKGRAYARRWRERHPEYNEKRKALPSYAKKYSQKAPGVGAAHQRVHAAIRRGELVRPAICPQCKREVFVEAAHLNYTGAMDIIWLCRKCHRAFDANQPKGAHDKIMFPNEDGRAVNGK